MTDNNGPARELLEFVADASDLGLRPGVFPRRVEYRRMTFAAVGVDRGAEGEVTGVRYESEDGRRLLVVND